MPFRKMKVGLAVVKMYSIKGTPRTFNTTFEGFYIPTAAKCETKLQFLTKTAICDLKHNHGIYRSCSIHTCQLSLFNPNTFAGLVVKVQKNYLPKEEGREGGEKSVCGAPVGAGAQTQDLPRARRGSPAAHQGGCLDKQVLPCL